MAKSTTRFVKQAKPIEYVEVRDGVDLSLTTDEAQTLVDILDFVGGTPRSRRRYAENIKNALNASGFTAPWNYLKQPPGVPDIDRSMPTGVYFKDQAT